MAERTLQLAEAPGRGRLGRNINHDAQSMRYLVAPKGVSVTPRSFKHERYGPILDQGDLGSCVPNSATGLLMTDPFWELLDKAVQKALGNAETAEAYAVQAYREVTRLDPYDGAWEPDDTGSDGLSIAKLWQQRGLNNGYQHITSIEAAHVAGQRGPFIVGTSWMSGMDSPTREGIVSASGVSRGGHEYLCREYDLTRDLWWFDNSWGFGFGVSGRFAYDTPSFDKLLGMQGDATSMVPVDKPAPVPTPAPPQPGGALEDFPFAQVNAWAAQQRSWWPKRNQAAAAAYTGWRHRHGL